jgi:hypothetical protein
MEQEFRRLRNRDVTPNASSRELTPHDRIRRRGRICSTPHDPQLWGPATGLGLGVGTMVQASETQNHTFNHFFGWFHSCNGLGYSRGFRSPVRFLRSLFGRPRSSALSHVLVWNVDFVCGNLV